MSLALGLRRRWPPSSRCRPRQRRAAVIGCGSPGLTAARQLQRRGFDVTIYAMTVPPDTTSNMSLAGFTPTTALVDNDRRTPAWDAQFLRAAEISYRAAAADGRPRTTASTGWTTTTPPTIRAAGPRRRTRRRTRELRDRRRAAAAIAAAQPQRAKCSARASIRSRPSTRSRTPALSIEPSIYLDALVRDFLMFGGRIVIRKFDTPRDLMSLAEPVVVNCTGPRLVHALRRQGARADQGAADGAGRRSPRWTIAPAGRTAERRQRQHERAQRRHHRRQPAGSAATGRSSPTRRCASATCSAAIEFFAAMRPPAPGARLTRSEPPRVAPPVEAFFDAES